MSVLAVRAAEAVDEVAGCLAFWWGMPEARQHEPCRGHAESCRRCGRVCREALSRMAA